MKKETKVSKVKKSSYEKRYDFIRDELYKLLPNEKSDICPYEMAIGIMCDCAVYASNSCEGYEGLGLLETAKDRYKEWQKKQAEKDKEKVFASKIYEDVIWMNTDYIEAHSKPSISKVNKKLKQ